MANMEFDPAKITAAAAQISQISGNYKSIYTSLIKSATTMGNAWEGQDNAQFTSQILGCCEDLDKMVKKLELMSETLTKQAANYTSVQDANISGAKKLAN